MIPGVADGAVVAVLVWVAEDAIVAVASGVAEGTAVAVAVAGITVDVREGDIVAVGPAPAEDE